MFLFMTSLRASCDQFGGDGVLNFDDYQDRVFVVMTGKILSSAAINLKGSSFASIFISLWHKVSRHSLSSHQVHL